jgi:glycosyltransferase involved in cell wall biosynthesis
MNEELRIKDAILSAKKNNPAEVIVIEGGSTDNTVEIAETYADKVFQVKPYNLGYKRYYGVLNATQDYILNMDADQVVEPDNLEIMFNELNEWGWVGIQAQLRSEINDTFWEKAMEATTMLTHGGSSETNMIGTPALFKRDILMHINFNPEITGSCDDTDLCYRLKKKGYRMGISTAICHQKHRANFKQVKKKFYWYGQGDFQFALLHHERLLSIFTHPLKNYMLIKSLKLMKRGLVKYSAFPIVAGFCRHLGFWKGFYNYVLKKKTDSRIECRRDLDF